MLDLLGTFHWGLKFRQCQKETPYDLESNRNYRICHANGWDVKDCVFPTTISLYKLKVVICTKLGKYQVGHLTSQLQYHVEDMLKSFERGVILKFDELKALTIMESNRGFIEPDLRSTQRRSPFSLQRLSTWTTFWTRKE